jgi:hypothetical protein
MKLALAALLSFSVASHAQTASIFIFDETESGNTPGTSRMIFTNNMIRIDDGNDFSGYVLYNSKTKLISSVSHDDSTVFEVKRPTKAVPEHKENAFTANQKEDIKAPKIAGKTMWETHFTHGVKTCGTVNTVKGLYTKELALLQDYYKTMQLDASANVTKTPNEFQSGCYLNNFIYHLEDYYQHGFPIAMSREDGYIRLLKGIEEKATVNNNLFTIPAKYKHYSVSIN